MFAPWTGKTHTRVFRKKNWRSGIFPVNNQGWHKKGSGGQFFLPGSPGTNLHTMSRVLSGLTLRWLVLLQFWNELHNYNNFGVRTVTKILILTEKLGGCGNWSRRSGLRNLDQIWTKSGHHLDRFFKNGWRNSRQDTLPTYEGINFGFRFVWEIQILSVQWLCTYKGRRNLGPFLNSTTKKILFVCTFTYKQRNEPIGPFLSCFMCLYIRRKKRSGPVQNGLDQSRIWTTCRPDFLIWNGVYLDLDRICYTCFL